MANTVRDRSGAGLPSKAERRALGKAAARKRAASRRRRELLSRVATVAAPVAVIAIIVAAVWFFSGGSGSSDPAASPTTDVTSSPEPEPAATFTLPPGADPALETKPEVTAGEGTVAELDVTTLIAGTGAAIQVGDVVTFNYVGVDYDSGEEFDSSWGAGGQPLVIPVGVGRLIRGWDQGLIGVTVGSRVQIDVPQSLAYPNGGGPEGDLRFVVDVLAIAE